MGSGEMMVDWEDNVEVVVMDVVVSGWWEKRIRGGEWTSMENK